MDITKNGKLIHLENPNDAMGQRIEAAKARAELAWEAKKGKSMAWDAEPDDGFSLEEFDAMISGNEFFQGKVISLSKKEQYERLIALGRWMEAKCQYVRQISIDKIVPSRKNATVRLDFSLMTMIEGDVARVYAAMNTLADDITISGAVQDRKNSEKVVRISFCVKNIWEE